MPEHYAISSQTTVAGIAATNLLPVQAQLQYGIDKESLQHLPVQRKLTVGSSDDPLEYEADRMADKVMQMPEQNFIQRKCTECEEEEKAQLKPLASSITPFIQAKGADSGIASENVSQKINSTKGSGSKMDSNTKSFMESRFGADFSNVKIHTGNYAVQMSGGLNAQAFTVGNDIYFNSGKYNTVSESGKHLLAHELTHTLQQGNGENTFLKIQRFLSTEPAGGCGICYGLPRNAGIAAHQLIQTEFEIMYPLGLVEFPISSPTDDNGRLDLAIATPTGLEIGEIKPANEEGYANGITDIAFYLAALSAAFPSITIRPLTRLIPPIIFPSLSPNCPTQMLYVNPPVSGVYGYWCSPGFSESLRRGCNCTRPVPRRVPERVPVRRTVPESTPEQRRDPEFMRRMAEITGLTGTALIIYLIISEGSRLFPPRNLIPVP